MKFRDLRADEIDCRINTVSAKGVSLLLYKDARVDQNILDETFGCMGWQRSHQMIGDRLYCTISVWDEDKKQWISKQDVGTESYTEKEKGQASDSFKRAAFNWGIGRELYTAPFIWVSSDKCLIKTKGSGFTCYDHFAVREIKITGGKISALTIVNNSQRGAVVYSLGETGKATDSGDVIDKAKVMAMLDLARRKGVAEKDIAARYKVASIREMDYDTWNRAMKALDRSKDKT